jgi:hypothetical protein
LVRSLLSLLVIHPGPLCSFFFHSLVTSSNGFPLDPGETVVVKAANLKDLWFDADVNGEKICWLRVW